MSKKIELKEKNESELAELLKQKREELRTLRFSIAGGRSKDGNALRQARADVARTMTELHARKRVQPQALTELGKRAKVA